MDRYNELVEILKHHSDLYYNQDSPEISDYEYDMLVRELKEIEKEHPEIISPDCLRHSTLAERQSVAPVCL